LESRSCLPKTTKLMDFTNMIQEKTGSKNHTRQAFLMEMSSILQHNLQIYDFLVLPVFDDI